MNQTEATATLNAVLEQQKKTQGEILTVQTGVTELKAKIVELEAAAGGAISDELAFAIAAVKEQAQVVDDAIPDAPAPEPTPEPA